MINIVDFIPKGKINAIPSVELSRRTGLVSRDIEKAVFEAALLSVHQRKGILCRVMPPKRYSIMPRSKAELEAAILRCALFVNT